MPRKQMVLMKNEKPNTLFNSELNNYCRKYLVKDVQLSREEISQFENTHNLNVASIFEQILLFDKISLKVYGENIPIAVLINNLGIKNFERLLEEDVFEFVLWTPVVTYLSSDIPGVMPLQSGNLNSPAHSVPSESIKMGFEWMKNQPDRKIRRELQRKIEKKYIIPSPDIPHNSANIVMQAYSSDKLAEFGMPKTKEIEKLVESERAKLCGYADDILETTILSQLNYSSFDNYKNYALTNISLVKIKDAFKIKENFNQILKTENIPDLKSLILNKHINFDSLIKLREKRIAKDFRSWLNNLSQSSDSEYVIKEYIDAITERKGFFETHKGKFVKTVSMYGVGVGVGTLVGGIPGTILGGPAAKMLEPALDLGLDFLDTYILDGLLKGWSPKIFIEELNSLISKKQQ
jgi:hypothetical protein